MKSKIRMYYYYVTLGTRYYTKGNGAKDNTRSAIRIFFDLTKEFFGLKLYM